MSPITPVSLRCEYATDPIGIDASRPRLSWNLESKERAQRQIAYQIIVSSSKERLRRDDGDLWDSKKVFSEKSLHIPYEGKVLTSRQRCYWKVRVWSDEDPKPTTSNPAFWEMGLLEPEDWRAEWIGLETDGDEPLPAVEDNLWIWLDQDEGVCAKEGRQQGYFRRSFKVPPGIEKAWLLINGDSLFRQYTNGFESSRNTVFQPRMQWVDLTYLLNPGENVLAIEASKSAPPAGLIGRLMVTFENAPPLVLDLDETWKGSSVLEEGWQQREFDDAHWPQVAKIAGHGQAPWGKQMVEVRPAPSPYLRKSFSINKEVVRGRLYATALGVYELRLNGARVSDARFAPGWTDYKKRLQVQTYDITELLRPGENMVGAILGDGWYAGHVGIFGRHQYGSYPLGFLAQLEIEYEDGTVERLGTDASWEGNWGPIISSDFLMGEIYDARLEVPGWDQPQGSNRCKWRPVTTLASYNGALVADLGPAIRVTKRRKPISLRRRKTGTVIFDMGQNMVGCVRLLIRGAKAGDRIALRFGEMLEKDGSLYTLNLRSARQRDIYICRGDDVEVYEPHFTFHGFRYVEVTGFPGRASLETIEGLVIHSDTPITGSFSCSHPLVNQLQRNILWGQRGNFLSVPTDCPQRDERLGWMGDAQVFMRTASFNADVAAFCTKWMVDVEDAQRTDGAFSDIAPSVGFLGGGNAGWGDAGVIIPWTIYLCYGDTRIIERHYEGMTRWIKYLKANSEGLIRPAIGYGDWLSIDADTPKDVIATAYFAYSTRLLSRMASAIGRSEDAASYEQLFERIRRAFNDQFVHADGRVAGETQTGYLLALHMDLLSEGKRRQAMKHLVRDIRSRGDRLSTGFLGCSYLLPELARAGELDLAYALLTSTRYPSWGYSIRQGATTMWERWDSYKEDGGFQDEGMNSFNHYAYGSVGEWLYRYVAGIEADPDYPGYKRFVLRPCPRGPLTWAKAEYNSVRGPIGVEWSIIQNELIVKLAIPTNTTATLYLPTTDLSTVQEGHGPIPKAVGVCFKEVISHGDFVYGVYSVGSGTYEFRCAYADDAGFLGDYQK
ncbi:MAG: glycoside hydrolase family 78 protein [Limnochordia bacterium]|nr:glycoside hydrolase family 78 protein [Limnochordia bacterium]